jgi:hypothetical protein
MRLPRTTTTRVSSGWAASISILLPITADPWRAAAVCAARLLSGNRVLQAFGACAQCGNVRPATGAAVNAARLSSQGLAGTNHGGPWDRHREVSIGHSETFMMFRTKPERLQTNLGPSRSRKSAAVTHPAAGIKARSRAGAEWFTRRHAPREIRGDLGGHRESPFIGTRNNWQAWGPCSCPGGDGAPRGTRITGPRVNRT